MWWYRFYFVKHLPYLRTIPIQFDWLVYEKLLEENLYRNVESIKKREKFKSSA